MTAEQIKAERRAKNLSQTELAKKAGVHLLTIFRAENGKVKPATTSNPVAKTFISVGETISTFPVDNDVMLIVLCPLLQRFVL